MKEAPCLLRAGYSESKAQSRDDQDHSDVISVLPDVNARE